MSTQTTDNFSAFASLHRFFSLIETTKPTPEQADKAVSQLYLIYGATSEEDLMERGAPELIQMYLEIKNKILSAAM
ncbi:hypothetical protein A8709_22665 [Paenibacillus pectinilyticus]|uniref:Uncharacterized protein n=1 Tax=Paenibacillus pectinilyticus TaxID=512399 RepID=A0A1C0ZRF2_9BACL|nr:hypothetical protein [Paenibacillus pectinilyticus]OCT10647.1 hypothetical protein A8709_22665 [Paenibacillus pectinilyticus]